jgi:hypothetical protein
VQVGFEVEFAAREEDCYSVVADWAGEDDLIPRTHRSRINVHARQRLSNSSGGDVHLVGLAMLDHFRVAGDNSNPGALGRACHGANFGFQNFCGQSFFENEGYRESFAASAGHGEIIHRAVDGEFADGATRKAKRLDYEAIRGNGEWCAIDPHVSGVCQWLRLSASKQRNKETFHQLAAGFAAGAVGHFDLWFAESDGRLLPRSNSRAGQAAV